jgi:hypothetical protein
MVILNHHQIINIRKICIYEIDGGVNAHKILVAIVQQINNYSYHRFALHFSE